MKGRGRCGRRKREKFETEEGRLGVPQTGTQAAPDAENNGSQGSQEGDWGRGALWSDQTGPSFITASGGATGTLRGQCEPRPM